MSPSAIAADDRRRSPALTRSEILRRIRRWEALYGEPPCSADWHPGLARWRRQEWRIERYYLGDPETGAAWPSTSTVRRRFGGSFVAAVNAALTIEREREPAKSHNGSGPTSLAAALRELTHVGHGSDPLALDAALTDLAREALAWRDRHRNTHDLHP